MADGVSDPGMTMMACVQFCPFVKSTNLWHELSWHRMLRLSDDADTGLACAAVVVVVQTQLNWRINREMAAIN